MPELTPQDIVRAWRDEEYRNSLPQEIRDRLPAKPAGAEEMSDEQLLSASGGGMLVDAAQWVESHPEVFRPSWND